MHIRWVSKGDQKMKTTYKIQSSNGNQGGAWRMSYDSLGDARDGLAEALGLDSVVLSPSYALSDRVDLADGSIGTAVMGWSGYETQAECDGDTDGAIAPRIVRIEA